MRSGRVSIHFNGANDFKARETNALAKAAGATEQRNRGRHIASSRLHNKLRTLANQAQAKAGKCQREQPLL
jgi:hypothetical protein